MNVRGLNFRRWTRKKQSNTISVMFKRRIIDALKIATGIKDINLDVTEREEFGDYSSNIAMQLFSKSQVSNSKLQRKYQSPRELAEEIVKKLKNSKNLVEIVDHIEVAGPGFINFWISKKFLLAELEGLADKGGEYGKSDLLKGKRIMFEFGQPNTHKLPHVGHLFSYIYGSACANILEFAGAKLFRANYQGDVGLHVAKCLWAFQKENPTITEPLEDKVKLLQEMYQKGSHAYDESDEVKKEINELNKKLYESDGTVQPFWQETRNWSLEYYSKFEKRLGIKYDRSYFESEVYKDGMRLVEENVGRIFEKSEGAVIFRGSRYNLHDRVFLTNYGTPTYEAKDMYLQTLKYKQWPFDLLVITTAHEQNEYFKVIYKALEELNPEFKGKLMHIGFGMVKLKSGKISSRTGDIVGAVNLVDEIVEKISKIVEKREELNDDEKFSIAETVGIGAVKYSFLKTNHLQDITFDINESISEEGNSGPYIQYTYARVQSVLRKANETFKGENLQGGYSNLELYSEELSLLRTFIHFTGVIENAAKYYSPNLLCNYLFDLAQKFNLFYNMHGILKQRTKNKGQSDFRLALTSATGQILKNGLSLLGIQTPERM